MLEGRAGALGEALGDEVAGAQVLVDGVELGHAGELQPQVCSAFGLPARSAAVEVDLDLLMTRAVDVVPGPVFSTYPVAKEDVALVVADDVPAGPTGLSDLIEE